MDLSKVKEGPWLVSQNESCPCIYSDSLPPGKNLVVVAAVHGGILSDSIEWNKDDLNFIALARNAIDFMIKYRIGVSYEDDGNWSAVGVPYHKVFPHPLLAIEYAMQFYKEKAYCVS